MARYSCTYLQPGQKCAVRPLSQAASQVLATAPAVPCLEGHPVSALKQTCTAGRHSGFPVTSAGSTASTKSSTSPAVPPKLLHLHAKGVVLSHCVPRGAPHLHDGLSAHQEVGACTFSGLFDSPSDSGDEGEAAPSRVHSRPQAAGGDSISLSASDDGRGTGFQGAHGRPHAARTAQACLPVAKLMQTQHSPSCWGSTISRVQPGLAACPGGAAP